MTGGTAIPQGESQQEIERRRQQSNLSGVVQQEDTVTDYYVQQHMTAQDYERDTRNKHMRASNIGSIRNAVMAVMPEAYRDIDAFRNETEGDLRKTKLHHSRGTRLALEGKEVLEFDISGSGFKQFRSDYRKVKGKSDIRDYMKANVHWYNKWFGWLPGVKSVKQIKREAKANAIQQAQEKELQQLQQELNGGNEEILYDHNEDVVRRYGEAQQIYINTKREKRKHVRKSVSQLKNGKTRITMAGPLALGGMSNSGDYSIENLREYMLQMGVDYLLNTLSSRIWIDNPHDIWLRFRGHSRGGVASVQGAMMIKKWVHDNIPEYENYIKFDVTQFDPVPGFGSDSGANKSVDMQGADITEGNAKMMPLGDSAETTVVYSMHSDHRFFFTPQEVAHTKRLIITPYAHSVGLGETDKQETNQKGEAHRAAFTDAATGEAYRLSSLNELPEGVYVLDEQNTLIRLNDQNELERIMNEALKKASGQENRHEVIKKMAGEWFAAHS